MFAGAAREVVFSKPAVVQHVNENFIPVALKAAMINNPPRGPEGALYAELSRSKPLPQGICTANSVGRVIAWTVAFEDESSILKFLDHVVDRYKSGGTDEQLSAERYRRFPTQRLPDMKATTRPPTVPSGHTSNDVCPANPVVEPGTLVGRIIGRPLDAQGNPIPQTLRQEEYMEARIELSPDEQKELLRAIGKSNGERIEIDKRFATALVHSAYLGLLDADPSGRLPQTENQHTSMSFWAQKIDTKDDNAGTVRIRIEGESDIAGASSNQAAARRGGRDWQHRVKLRWQGFASLKNNRFSEIVMTAIGNERLVWQANRENITEKDEIQQLLGGHPINLDAPVRYGLWANSGD